MTEEFIAEYARQRGVPAAGKAKKGEGQGEEVQGRKADSTAYCRAADAASLGGSHGRP